MYVKGRLEDGEIRKALAEYLARVYGLKNPYPDLALRIGFVITQEPTPGRLLHIAAEFDGEARPRE